MMQILTRSLTAVALLFGLGSALAASHAEPTAVRYIHDWKWEGQAAPLLLAQDAGLFADEGLDVSLSMGNGSLDAIPKVASGEYDLGSADINSLILWRDQNPDIDLKAIYIIYNAPPFAVLGRPSLGVVGPQDLEGHTLGAPSADGAFAQWPALVRANGIIADRVDIEDVSFAERADRLADGDVDAITGFSFTSFINLQQKGVPTSDISLMLMSDFGLDLYGNAIIVNPDFAERDPDAVRAFLRAAVRGFQNTIAHPRAALDSVLARNETADPEVELQRLVMAIGHNIVTEEVRQNGLGAVSVGRLEKSIEQLDSVHDFARRPGSEEVFDPTFLPALDRRLLLEEGTVPDTTSAQTEQLLEAVGSGLLEEDAPVVDETDTGPDSRESASAGDRAQPPDDQPPKADTTE